MLDRHFVRSTIDDDAYHFGPKVALKAFNEAETVSLTVSEFITPNIFFACESVTNILLDRHINLLYDSMSWPFKFSRLPQVGTTCVGRYSVDNRWYRARVVNSNKDKDTVDLIFIDYGNIGHSVKLENIRKLEGTLSTQFSSFMNCSKLNSQGALFGYVGVMPNDSSDMTVTVLKDFEMKRYFDFQIVSIPQLKANLKNDLNINLPFYLIKCHNFNKDLSTNYNECIINELKWQKCSIEESLRFLVRSFKSRQFHFTNIHILLPRLLEEFQDDFNTKAESIHSLDGDDNDRCVTPEYNEGELSDEETEGSVSSVNVSQKRREHDIIICSDENEEIQIKNNKDNYTNNYVEQIEDCKYQDQLKDRKIQEPNDDKYQELNENDKIQRKNKVDKYQENDDDKYQEQNEDDIDMIPCSIVKWERTSHLVKSTIQGLEWHLPIPEDPILKAIITTFNEELEFHINICSKDITSTFECMEKQLSKHFILCNDSMLKHYVTSDSDFCSGMLCLGSYKSTYIRCFVIDSKSNGNVTCRLIDFGDEIVLNKSDLIPISDQFCQIPPLAIKCVLSGLKADDSLRDYFHSVVEDVDYQVLISLCLADKEAHFTRNNENIVVEQPITVEVFIVKLNENNETNLISVNDLLLKRIRENKEQNIEEDTKLKSNERCTNDLDTDENGMNDIFLNENLHQQANMNNQDGKRPVCEYFRSKGRCFKGSKCRDRHVTESDESDNESEDWKMMEKMHYLNDDFERQLILGSVIGIRVSAIYTCGIFYGYLTHDIHGFLDDTPNYFENDLDCYDDIGLEFKSIQDMEINLKEFLQFQQVNVDTRFQLPVNTMVAVSADDMVHRGAVRRRLSSHGGRYQVFLVDYGVLLEAHIKNMSLLPGKYLSGFRQQCFMFKLSAVAVSPDDSVKFANWFYEKVNRKVLHCKIIDIDQDGTNYVELYNFIDNVDQNLNAVAKDMFQTNS